jgi:hypothetical protein
VESQNHASRGEKWVSQAIGAAAETALRGGWENSIAGFLIVRRHKEAAVKGHLPPVVNC